MCFLRRMTSFCDPYFCKIFSRVFDKEKLEVSVHVRVEVLLCFYCTKIKVDDFKNISWGY